MNPAVDLVVNTYQRTYRDVLKEGFFIRIEAQNHRPFSRKVALINNVADKKDASRRARKLLAQGEINEFFFVEEQLDRALQITSLTRQDLGRIPHYSDWALVAVTLPGSPWLLCWDAELQLREPVNWIDPAILLMEQDWRIFVANPNWWRPGLEYETRETKGSFALGYGFSDQCFLVRRADLARPIYRCFCPVSLRYPLAHVASIFEQRVDAYMRSHRRMRATYIDAVYEHPENEGASYPSPTTFERLRLMRNRLLLKLLRCLPTRNPFWKV